ncbi:MAG: histidine kinase, partial [Owenweeksia sp.]
HNALGLIEHSHYREIPLHEDNSEGLRGMLWAQGVLYGHTSNKLYTLSENGSRPDSLAELKCGAMDVIKDIYMTSDSAGLRIASSSGLYTCGLKSGNTVENNGFYKRATSVLSFGYKNLVGTPNGLYLGPVSGTNYRLTHHKVLSRANITDLVMMDRNTCLIATASDGLFTYGLVSDSIFKPVVSPDSYLGNIHEVFREDANTFWLATDQGVFHFTLIRGYLQRLGHYTVRDGLPSNNTTSVWVTKNALYVATSAGLAVLNRSPRTSFNHATVSILRATTDNGFVFFPKNLSFKYPTPNISLHLSSFSFEHLGQTSYRYTLEGNNPAWFISSNPIVYFNDLSPGEYTFRVRAIGPERKSEGSPTTLPLIIRPAYWQTIWFRLLIGLLATGLFTAILYFILFRLSQRSYRKLQQTRKLAELELEAIKAQINPHFIFNCLNSIQLFTYRGDVENAQQYLDRFSLLIRQTMRLSQQRFTMVQEEVLYLSNYLLLEKMRFKDQLEYHLDIQENIDPLRILPAMLLQPYIENALKHGIAHHPEKGELIIRLMEADDHYLEVHIHDNGPGFHKKPVLQKSNGLGMRLSGSRIETYNELFQLNIQLEIQSPPEEPAYGRK